MSAADPRDGPGLGTLRELVLSVSARLQSQSEAKWMVAQAAGVPPRRLMTVLDDPVSSNVAQAVGLMVRRRGAGEPLQYVLGEWSFRRLDVMVDDRALIPRPETEQVVEVALEELQRLVADVEGVPTDPFVVVDLGTGSGVIALSLALEGVDGVLGGGSRGGGALTKDVALAVWATDVSAPALDLTRSNLAGLAARDPSAAARVTVAEGPWFAALPPALAGHVHLVVSNPPYVSDDEWSDLDADIKNHEPRAALVPGPTGLEALVVLIDEARRWLVPGGRIVLEMAPGQAGIMTERAMRAGYVDVRVRPDLAGRARVLVAAWPGG